MNPNTFLFLGGLYDGDWLVVEHRPVIALPCPGWPDKRIFYYRQKLLNDAGTRVFILYVEESTVICRALARRAVLQLDCPPVVEPGEVIFSNRIR